MPVRLSRSSRFGMRPSSVYAGLHDLRVFNLTFCTLNLPFTIGRGQGFYGCHFNQSHGRQHVAGAGAGDVVPPEHISRFVPSPPSPIHKRAQNCARHFALDRASVAER